MKTLKFQIQTTLSLGLLSLLAGLAAHLALTDIFHAEGDLSLEWNILRACAVILAAFTMFSLFTLRRVLKTL